MKVKVKYYTPIINWCDYQRRIYKNHPNIKWINKVHETLIGYEKWAIIPHYEDLCLLHSKNIKKQEEQNNTYSSYV
jgi:hypothetical protein